MLSFSKKRFFITLGLSILIWFITVLIQGVSGYKAPFNLLSSASICKVTGFPIATCSYSGKGYIPFWLIDLINIFFWFWVLHFSWNWFKKSRG